jgi:phosphoadenosine phosphosulfate reductase
MAVAVTPDFESRSAEELLASAADRFHRRLYVACSFQKEASVIMDMLLRIQPAARFFTIDNGELFDETHATKRALEERYGIEVDVFDASDPDGGRLTAENCCGEHKVAAFRRAVANADAWVSGLRREQSPERAGAPKFHWDERHALWKVNPLADWSERDVWAYIAENDVPYHPLHDQGYESIGCRLCTRPGSGRQGRWADTDQTECGIHG